MSQSRVLSNQRTDSNSSYDLRSPGWLAERPAVGATLFVIGILLFGLLAYNVWTSGPLIRSDVSLARQFHGDAVQADPQLIEYMMFGFFVGKELLQVMVIILILYFLHKRFWPELAMVLIGSAGGALLWSFLIETFDRPRPESQLGIVVTDPSFPSGHAISSVVCYGLLAYLLVPHMPSLFWKWLIGIAALVTVAFTGFSRLYLGGHYLTDVLAGYGLGLAWAVLVVMLVEQFFIRRKA